MNRFKKSLIMFLTIAFSIFAVGAAYTAYLSKNRVSIPVSENFDGKRFRNPVEKTIRSSDLRKWRKESKKNRIPWPEHREIKKFPPPPMHFNEPGKALITFISHATLLIQVDGINIITDPFYSDRASPVKFAGPKRVHAPGVAFDELPKTDIVLISHNHYDHLDIPALKKLWYRDKPKIFVPLGDDVVVHRNDRNIEVTAMNWNDSREISEAMSVHFLRTQHWSARTPYDRNKSLWGAFAIKTKTAGNIYFGGDTGYGDGSQFTDAAKQFGSFSVALLPIGAYAPRWFMSYSHINPEEAVTAMKNLNAKRTIGMHFGTVRLTDEGIDDPVKHLNEALSKAGFNNNQFGTLLPGESMLISIRD